MENTQQFNVQEIKIKRFDKRRDLFKAGDDLILLGFTSDSYPERASLSVKILRRMAKEYGWDEEKLRTSIWHFEKVVKSLQEGSLPTSL